MLIRFTWMLCLKYKLLILKKKRLEITEIIIINNMQETQTKLFAKSTETYDYTFNSQIQFCRTETKKPKRSTFRISCDSKKTIYESQEKLSTQFKEYHLKIREQTQQKLHRVCTQALILLKILKNKKQIVKGYQKWFEQIRIHKQIFKDLFKKHQCLHSARQNSKMVQQLVNIAKVKSQHLVSLLHQKKQTCQSIKNENHSQELQIQQLIVTIPLIKQQIKVRIQILQETKEKYLDQLFECFIIKEQKQTINKNKGFKTAKLNKERIRKYTFSQELTLNFSENLKITFFMFLNTISIDNPSIFLNKHSHKNVQLHQHYQKKLFKKILKGQTYQTELEQVKFSNEIQSKTIKIFFNRQIISQKMLKKNLVELSTILNNKNPVNLCQSKLQFEFRYKYFIILLEYLPQQFCYSNITHTDQFYFFICQ